MHGLISVDQICTSPQHKLYISAKACFALAQAEADEEGFGGRGIAVDKAQGLRGAVERELRAGCGQQVRA